MSVHIPKDGRWIVQYPNPEPPPRLKREYFGRGLEGEKRAMDCNEALGYRPGQKELLRLKWPDIDWDLQTILVHSARKGGIKSRMVPIHDNFLPILNRNKPILRISKTFSATKKKRESQEDSRPMPFAMPLQQIS